jgi:flagellar biosynthesis anti-sigma factor FlgM
MSVRIGGTDNSAVTQGAGGASAARDGHGRARTGAENQPGPQPASVQITGTASQLAGLEQKLNSLPAVDEGRVAEVSRALAAGQYVVDARKTAAGLMESERVLTLSGLA